MNERPTSPRAADAIRAACVAAAIEGYEDALTSGLCREGAWEAAISGVRRLDLSGLGGDEPPRPAPADSDAAIADDEAATNALSRRFAAPGAPAAGSAVAATAAIAAGLVVWVAAISQRRAENGFQRRARAIERRADTIREALASAAAHDSGCVLELIAIANDARAHSARERAAESSLEIARRSAQAAILAAELAAHAPRSCRADVEVARRLAVNAGEVALELFEASLPGLPEGSEWMRATKRRAWRVRLLLGRSTPDES